MRTETGDRTRRSEALLEATRADAGGRLKIFIGAAPGVGKTYEMLQTAAARRREGVDVVAGVVETHGRSETAALLDGLEVLPRRVMSYKGRMFEELDLDALLKRRPALALIDELAHTNAPGSRHPKRFLDVEELLAVGIDVYTTLNIQHVESLNDVVAQITRIRVRETVPDRMLDRADDIELVDLTPEDLIRRLQDGKVYLPRNAERALAHYFSPGNLTALRELALRRTAQRVDDQLRRHMRTHSVEGPWAAGEHILVCIDDDPGAVGLVRYAKRLADRLHASWTAIHVDDQRGAKLSEPARDCLAETMRLVQHLDGEVVRVPNLSARVADDVLGYATETNVTQIVLGRTRHRRGTLVRDLVRDAGGVGVTVLDATAAGGGTKPRRPAVAGEGSARPLAYGAAVAAVGAALAFGVVARPVIGLESIDLVFLAAVIGIAAQCGRWPSLLAVLLSSLAYNFFFLPPLYTFTITDPTNVAAFVFFTLVALVVSNLAARARFQTLAAKQRTRTTEALYGFSRKLASCKTIDDVLWTMAYQIAAMLKVRVVLLLPAGNSVELRAGYPPEDELDDADLAAALWAYTNGTAAGRGADTLPGAKRLFLPLRTGRGTVGVVGLDDDRAGPLLTPDAHRLIDALSDGGALAIERMVLMEDLERAKLVAETDRLRQALLTSISHDLKTPLAAIFGAAGTMRDLHDQLDESAKRELLDTVIDESERLNRFIANLLDMTKLESGAVMPNAAPHDIGDVLGAALRHASKILAGHHLEVDVAPDLPMPIIDPVLLEQAIFNILDNAAKYGEPGTSIRVEAWRYGQRLHLRISDQGHGVPAEDLERIFDKFYRAQKGDSVRAGTGLGLAIARGFVAAMGGTLVASNRPDGPGASFTFSLPVPLRAARLESAA